MVVVGWVPLKPSTGGGLSGTSRLVRAYRGTSLIRTCPPHIACAPRRTTRRILELRALLNWHSSQFKNNHSTAMCCGTSYLRLIDSCITQRKAQGPSRTCNESKEEEKLRVWGLTFFPSSLSSARCFFMSVFSLACGSEEGSYLRLIDYCITQL